MKISATLPDHGLIVEACLEGFVLAAAIMIQAGAVPPFPWLAGVKYRKERGEEWLLPNQVIEAGQGDCEDLSIWAAAGYRVTGQDPAAQVTLRMTGPREVHAVVLLSTGRVADPSLQMAAMERQLSVSGVNEYVMSLGGVMGDVMVREHRGDPSAPRRPSTAAPPAAASAGERNPLAKAIAAAQKSPTGISTMDVSKEVDKMLAQSRAFERASRPPSTVPEPQGKENKFFNELTGAVERPRASEARIPVDPATGMPVGVDPVTGLPYGQLPPYGYPPYGYPSYGGGPATDYMSMLYEQYMQNTPTLDYDVTSWPSYQELYGYDIPPSGDEAVEEIEEASSSYIDVDSSDPSGMLPETSEAEAS